ncbi:membrane-bound transcription factor site-2 protease-like [Anopheles albimanus]|uniref:membrane-bound transcription factor site-2 protease-like n=1 Tax=Anopheles albimanus TaxID=7167 RepID=UPI00163F492C|nr:membrane-bound transcription factor site-2 protease-like [Anopheles albimanus]
MELIFALALVVVIYLVLLFFDGFFKSCMHYPYDAFLRSTGLSVKFLRLQWRTTGLNRSIVKWSTKYPRILDWSFNVGVYLSLLLMPFAVVLIVASSFHSGNQHHSIGGGGGASASAGAGVGGGKAASNDRHTERRMVELDLLIPGVNLPISEIGYYIAALAINSIVHELGHGLAAVLEDVQIRGFGMQVMLIIPIAYTQLDTDQLMALKVWKRLRVLCAGIWHNLILGLFTYLLFVSTPMLFSSLYRTNEAVIVTGLKNNSPLAGARGLEQGDIIKSINACGIHHEESWFACLLQTIQSPPAYCVSTDFVHLNDESVPISHKNDGLIECCDSENTASSCFEYLVDANEDDVALPQHMCLNIRKTIENSFGYCHHHDSGQCAEGHCFKPSINNYTTIMQIRREAKPDVIYIGHPADLSRTVQISRFVPKTDLFGPRFADSIQLLLKYVTVFALGLAFINVMPCYGFDGQHIVNTLLTDNLIQKRIPQKATRDMISLVINVIGTLFVFILLIKVFWLSLYRVLVHA